jgi:transcriptional regulator GlxA family with amidase domain
VNVGSATRLVLELGENLGSSEHLSVKRPVQLDRCMQPLLGEGGGRVLNQRDRVAEFHSPASRALYLDQGNVVTGAGAAAGIDMCLHLIRRDHGAALANSIARILVAPPHRDGGQQQFITAPIAVSGDGDRLADVIAWARANLDRQLSLDELAARALMSRRSFVRHFKAATGTTPHAWLLSQRLSQAEELLEATTLSVEQIAERVGYRSAAVFREQFAARRGLAPRDYRRTFSHSTRLSSAEE